MYLGCTVCQVKQVRAVLAVGGVSGPVVRGEGVWAGACVRQGWALGPGLILITQGSLGCHGAKEATPWGYAHVCAQREGGWV